MKNIYFKVILHLFGVKPKQNPVKQGVKISKTVLPDAQCGSFNVWVKQVYHQLNPNIC